RRHRPLRTSTGVQTGERYELTAYDGYWGDAPELTDIELQVAEKRLRRTVAARARGRSTRSWAT
ncbi:hypothetical protein JS562_55760, partial [Agrobacterium sp. S2]|nr:hypothetical protein [Agrobacterium sp. S2]